MVTIRHAFLDHAIDPRVHTLIVGTFNPGAPWVDADFFYSSPRNYLWTILPAAFGEKSLKQNSKAEKLAFCEAKFIGFIDLISEVEVEEGQESNRSDIYIDGRSKWRRLDDELEKLTSLKRACFTRRSFSKIPEIRCRYQNLAAQLRKREIELRPLISPARYYSVKKQSEWNTFLVG